MSQSIVIVGAGAIGRGFLPWCFAERRYEFVFVDANPRLVEQLDERAEYTIFMVKDGRLAPRTVRVRRALLPAQFHAGDHRDAAAVFVNVGPRNVESVAHLVSGLSCPVISCENDPATVDQLRAGSGRREIYFAIPDVIASNTAPAELLAQDPLSVICENGRLFVDEAAAGVDCDWVLCNRQELDKQWTAKLYLHNTPHCIAAYLGSWVGAAYVHEAMRFPAVAAIVKGAMTEMLTSLKLRWNIPHPFLDWYAEKELARFSSELLFDPISRVAREPLRKLELEGRLLGAAQICLSSGFVPANILTGIASALLFQADGDADNHLAFMRRALRPSALLTHVLNLRKGEALECVLREQLPNIVGRLASLARGAEAT